MTEYLKHMYQLVFTGIEGGDVLSVGRDQPIMLAWFWA